MAETFEVSPEEGYQYTTSYSVSSPTRRRQLNRYKKECGISDTHMYLLLTREELDAIDKGTIDKADTTPRIILIIGVLLFWGSMQTALQTTGVSKLSLMAISIVSFLIAVAVYFSGVLNPYKRAERKLNKLMKDMPEVPDFEEWSIQNPPKEEVKAQRAKQRQRRR